MNESMKEKSDHQSLTWRTVWPGEWTCDNAGYIWADSLKGGRTHMIDVRGWGYLTGRGSGALGLASADAERLMDDLGKLLCAAPDLLEAATLALEDLYIKADKDEEPDQWSSVKALRAAIAKATGEAA
jgi:hypothetical protein